MADYPWLYIYGDSSTRLNLCTRVYNTSIMHAHIVIFKQPVGIYRAQRRRASDAKFCVFAAPDIAEAVHAQGLVLLEDIDYVWTFTHCTYVHYICNAPFPPPGELGSPVIP